MILRSKKLRWFEALDELRINEFAQDEKFLEIVWDFNTISYVKNIYQINSHRSSFINWDPTISTPWLQGRDLVNRPEIDINKTPKVFL